MWIPKLSIEVIKKERMHMKIIIAMQSPFDEPYFFFLLYNILKSEDHKNA
jgi:hypothetical protein